MTTLGTEKLMIESLGWGKIFKILLDQGPIMINKMYA